MKKLLSVSVLVAGMIATSAVAADLATVAPEPAAPLPTAYNWAGPYIGAQAGYSFGNFSSYSTNLVGTFPVNFDHDINTFRAGLHAGYNLQFDHYVVGVEGDIGFGAGDDERRTPAFGVVYTANTKSNFDGSLRLRVGYAIDNFLIYGTGGLAFGNVETKYGCDGCVDAASAIYKVSDTRIGWTIGAGLEYAFTENLSARLEYRYTDLGKKTEVFPSPIVAISHDNEYTSNQVMLGVTYHFH